MRARLQLLNKPKRRCNGGESKRKQTWNSKSWRITTLTSFLTASMSLRCPRIQYFVVLVWQLFRFFWWMSPFCHSCQILSFFCHFTTVFVLSFWMFCHFCQFSSFCHFCQFCQFLLLWSFLSFLKKFNSRSALKFIFNLVVDKANIWNTHLEQLRLNLISNATSKHRK